MATKFADFLEAHGLNSDRLTTTSQHLERLRPADRQRKLALRKAKSAEKSDKKEAPAERPAKPRSGRPVSPQLIRAAAAGKAISGASKTRLLRAVNHVLARSKQDPVDIRALF